MTLRSYDATYDVFKGYDLTILENLYNSALMPSLHLLRSSYDGLVYDFPCDLGGSVGGYGLRFLCLHYLRSSCDFMYWAA